jgi:hypothetical protein
MRRVAENDLDFLPSTIGSRRADAKRAKPSDKTG